MLNYPLELGFKIVTIGTRVRVTDAAGGQIAYVRKKKFKLKEDVRVYEDEDQRDLLFRIRADSVVDFGASYAISGPDGRPLGAVKQQGMRSLWKSTYDVSDPLGKSVAVIHEENPFVKVLDSLAEAIPFGRRTGRPLLQPRLPRGPAWRERPADEKGALGLREQVPPRQAGRLLRGGRRAPPRQPHHDPPPRTRPRLAFQGFPVGFGTQTQRRTCSLYLRYSSPNLRSR
jgi:uncharacterized protein YxjI